MKTKILLIKKALLVPLFFLFLIALSNMGNAQTVSIFTDQDDYAPGEMVIITGSGWISGDQVQLTITHIGDYIPDHTHTPWTLTADANGDLYDEWPVGDIELNTTMWLQAQSLTFADMYAEKIFTDSQTDLIEFDGTNFKITGNGFGNGVSVCFVNIATNAEYCQDQLAAGGSGSNQTLEGAIPNDLPPGTYNIVVYNNGGNQIGSTFGEAYSVCTSPTISLASVTPESVCGPDQVTFAATASAGTVKWYDASVGGTEITDLTPTITETTTYYAEAVDGDCVSASRTAVTATVNPVPVVAEITGLASVCVGSEITLLDETDGGVWSSSDEDVATVDAGVVSGISDGTATISYTVKNEFDCETTVTKEVSVHALPVVAEITGLADVCVGSEITLLDETDGGVWSSSNEDVTTVDAGVVSGISDGTATISYTVKNDFDCETTVTKEVSVHALPVVAEITGLADVCVGSEITLLNETDGGVWSSSNEDIATVDAGVVSGVSEGIATISYTVKNEFDCATTVTKEISVHPLPTGTMSGPKEICQDESGQITFTAGVGTGPWTFYYQVNGANQSVTTTDLNTVVTIDIPTDEPGLITYTLLSVSDANGCSQAQSGSVAVNVRAKVQITKLTIDGAEIPETEFNYGCTTPQLKVYATGYQTFMNPLRYQWYVNGSLIPGAILPVYNVPPATGVGYYEYKVVVNGYCGSAEKSVTVIIDQQPADADLDADSYYTGPNIAWTPTATSNTATVTLSAFLRNSSADGAECGDIRTARVTFLVNGSRIPSATNLPVDFLDPSNPSKGGTASAIVQLNISNSVSSEVFEIKVEIGGNYKAAEAGKQISEILVGKVQPGGSIGGGAKLLNVNSTGFVKGFPLLRTTAVFGVEYTLKGKSVTSPKGRVTLYIPSFNDRFGNPTSTLHWYFVKSNAIAGLAITSPTATFTSKCNISEYDPLTGATNAMEGNCTMVVDLGDYSNRCPNVLDKVGITVYRNAGGVWYSNNWVNTKTVMTNIFGGDVNVTGATIASPIATKSAEIATATAELPVEPMLKVFPNPFTEQLNIQFSSAMDTDALLEVFSITGAKLQTLYSGPVKAGILNTFEYKPRLVSSQMIIYRLTMSNGVQTGKANYQEGR